MKIEKIIKKLTLEEKIKQLFIVGFDGPNPEDNKDFQHFLEKGLGGVIFFTQNIHTKEQFKQIIKDINKKALIPPFLSIDQEGGRVERTENIHSGKKYLSAKSAAKNGDNFLIEQTQNMAKELLSYGINMNFAPVLDVNTNENNPIIGERAYSNNPEDVIHYSRIVTLEYIKNNILPVGKHFPGHGDASLDSHITLPTINLTTEELEQTHIRPFKELILQGIPAIMVAHVNYPAFNKEKIPASMSNTIINEYLIKKLHFNGIVISDDMIMGAIKGFSPIDACITSLKAGINMFIFRNCNASLEKITKEISKAVKTGDLQENIIDFSIRKILTIKENFHILP